MFSTSTERSLPEAAGDKDLALNDRATLEKLDPLRARKVKVSWDYILMDVTYVERRNQADKERLLNTYRTSITEGEVVIVRSRSSKRTSRNMRHGPYLGNVEGGVRRVTDYVSYPKFMPDVDETTVRGPELNEGTCRSQAWTTIGLRQEIPPEAARFHLKNGDGRTQISWKKLPWPGLKAKETVVDTYGQWIIEDCPDTDGQVLAYYRVYTDIGEVPLGTGWIVDTLTTESIEDMFKGTRRRVKDLTINWRLQMSRERSREDDRGERPAGAVGDEKAHSAHGTFSHRPESTTSASTTGR